MSRRAKGGPYRYDMELAVERVRNAMIRGALDLSAWPYERPLPRDWRRRMHGEVMRNLDRMRAVADTELAAPALERGTKWARGNRAEAPKSDAAGSEVAPKPRRQRRT